MLRQAGFLKAHRGAQYHGGRDSPDVQCPELPTLHFEVKAVERLNVGEAMGQAVHDAGAAKTHCRCSHAQPLRVLVTMRAEDWLDWSAAPSSSRQRRTCRRLSPFRPLRHSRRQPPRRRTPHELRRALGGA